MGLAVLLTFYQYTVHMNSILASQGEGDEEPIY